MKLPVIGKWSIAAIALLAFSFVVFGIIAWFWFVDGLPAPKPTSHYTDWIEEKWREEGRGSDSWTELEAAQVVWERIGESWWDRPDLEEIDFLEPFEVICRGAAPRDDDLYVDSIEHINKLRNAGFYDQVCAYRNAGAGLKPWGDDDLWNQLTDRTMIGSPRTSLQYCAAAARLAAVDGDSSAATEYFRDMLALASSAGADRIHLSQLICCSLVHMAIDEMCFEALELSLDGETLRELIAIIIDDPRPTWQECQEGERRWSDTIGRHGLVEMGLTRAIARRSYAALSAKFVEENANKSALELWKNPPGVVDTDRWFERAMDGSSTPAEAMAQVATSTQMIVSTQLQIDIELRGTISLLAIELFRAEHNGTLPATLDEALRHAGLDPSFGIDPIWNTPFIFKHDPSAFRGYILYAIGDGVDDGGVFPTDGSHLQAISREPVGLDVNFMRQRPSIE